MLHLSTYVSKSGIVLQADYKGGFLSGNEPGLLIAHRIIGACVRARTQTDGPITRNSRLVLLGLRRIGCRDEAEHQHRVAAQVGTGIEIGCGVVGVVSAHGCQKEWHRSILVGALSEYFRCNLIDVGLYMFRNGCLPECMDVDGSDGWQVGATILIRLQAVGGSSEILPDHDGHSLYCYVNTAHITQTKLADGLLTDGGRHYADCERVLARNAFKKRILTPLVWDYVLVVNASNHIARVVVVQREAKISTMREMAFEKENLVLMLFKVVGVFPIVDVKVGIGTQFLAVSFQRFAPLLFGYGNRKRVIHLIVGTGRSGSQCQAKANNRYE